MIVRLYTKFRLDGRRARLSFVVFLAGALATSAFTQGLNTSSAANPFFGSVVAQPRTADIIKLGLDDAVKRGLENNLGLKQAESQESVLHGERNQALQQFLPTITFTADTGFYEHNLAAQGFSPSVFKKFASAFPPGTPLPKVSFITKDTLTQGQVHYSQTLFSGPVIAGWKAAGATARAAHFGKMTARGEVVQQVATAYLHAIAASSEVDNAKALVAQSQVLLDHAHAAHEAGVAANIDENRAKVQLQAQQQLLIAAQNQYQKDLILLKREIGLDPGQDIVLSDPAPYSDLTEQSPEEVRATAYKNRQDYQNLQNLIVGYKAIHAAYRSQRFPTLQFNSYYGTSTVNGAGTHGNFLAMGTLSIPIFREAGLRGNEDASQAQLDAVNAQLADLRIHIDQQVRSALLDVAASKQLVEVSRSNVELATAALSDETDRVNAGVDDNLPLVTAQASLATAEGNLVQSLYRYNVSKLALARAAGVLELQYRDYLGK
jgi:outer membrane protein TolC